MKKTSTFLFSIRILCILSSVLLLQYACTPPYPSRGSLKTFENFPSVHVDSRRVDVWLPENFSPEEKYAVIYMHDGQNLFDPEFAFGGQIWAADEALQTLISSRKVIPAIIVGIWNSPKKIQEYLPMEAYDLLPDDLRMILQSERTDRPISDRYLKFIVHELKPFIDKNFPTLPDRRNTFIIGSSLGGLISVYALAVYPEIFGGAACLSTHWPLSLEHNEPGFSQPFIRWLGHNLPPPALHKIYFDFGTETLDERYPMHQQQMDAVMTALGYPPDELWITRKFPGDAHNEAAWRRRVQVPMEFFLKTE